MRVADRKIGTGQPPYIVAELGVNHDGVLDRALRLVEAAHHARADAVKVQWFEAAALLSRAARPAGYQAARGLQNPFEMLRALELDESDLAAVVTLAHQLGLHAVATLFSVDHVARAHMLPFDAFKTASPDVVNRPLIEALIATGRPLLVSTGAADLTEVETVTKWLGDHPHVLMHCVSSYPVPDVCASLAGRAAMLRVNPRATGYSDHTTAVDTGALAVASGVCILEKHLTLDREAPGPDHAASLDPEAFGEYVRAANRAWRMLGPPDKRVLDIERDVREVSRQSVTAVHDLPAGHVLAAGEITLKRPGTGLPPSRLGEIVGRRLARAVRADMPLTEEDLA